MNDSSPPVRPGVTRLLESERGILGDARVGLIANSACVDEKGAPTAVALLKAGSRVKRIFSPEHGYEVSAGPGEATPDTFDAETGLRVHSLYGAERRPTEETLSDVDAIVFDLQDVGVRCYTYIWTMALAMQSAALFGKLFVVLDRPNPIGGESTEGRPRWSHHRVSDTNAGNYFWAVPSGGERGSSSVDIWTVTAAPALEPPSRQAFDSLALIPSRSTQPSQA